MGTTLNFSQDENTTTTDDVKLIIDDDAILSLAELYVASHPFDGNLDDPDSKTEGYLDEAGNDFYGRLDGLDDVAKVSTARSFMAAVLARLSADEAIKDGDVDMGTNDLVAVDTAAIHAHARAFVRDNDLPSDDDEYADYIERAAEEFGDAMDDALAAAAKLAMEEFNLAVVMEYGDRVRHEEV